MMFIKSWPRLLPLTLFSLTLCQAQEAKPDFAALTAAAHQANQTAEPVAPGPFQPNWDSLKQYQFPDWFRDAKFGIWAHWGPQCQPEEGDWYARNMYQQYNKKGEPNPDYVYHVSHYGHPSIFGFKDILPLWKAENWDPDRLLALYKKAGAKYFMALANHHDNFDTWDSKYQPFNSVNIGPHRDLIAGWAQAARTAGLRFGVSVHAARAWGWNENSRHSDKDGPKAGVPYDGNLTADQGHGLWWDGLDPQQDLYAQNHGISDKPSPAYMQKFYNRTMDLINRYHPDLLYFDDDISGGLPLYRDDPTIGLRIAAHFYNTNEAQHNGQLEAVIAAKKLTEDRKKVLLYDIERGASPDILPQPWETDTCIGQWHYNRGLADRNGYKKSPDVIRMLADIVSKNGNLMLSIPVRSDGMIDDHEIEFLSEMGAWMDVNGEGLYATRPWKIFGEGPPTEIASVTTAAGEVAEKKTRPFDARDIRFTASQDGRTLYAIALGWPESGQVTIQSLATGSPLYPGKVGSVTLLGATAPPAFQQDATGLHVTLPAQMPGPYAASALVLKITP